MVMFIKNISFQHYIFERQLPENKREKRVIWKGFHCVCSLENVFAEEIITLYNKKQEIRGHNEKEPTLEQKQVSK